MPLTTRAKSRKPVSVISRLVGQTLFAALTLSCGGESTAPVTAASVTLSASSVALPVGSTHSLTAITKDAGGTVLTNHPITWSSSNSAVATVAGGIITGVSVGSATITATADGVSASVELQVLTPVFAISVSPASPSIGTGSTQQLSAATLGATGETLSGRTIAWSSSNPAIATVNATTGLVTGVAVGTTSILAKSEGKTGATTITVQTPASSVTVSPSSHTVFATTTHQLSATVADASGATLSGRTVTWSSSNSAAATVSASGVVTGIASGSATITATVDGKSGTAAITVAEVVPGGAISVDYRSSCGLTVAGIAYCWGHEGTSTATPPNDYFLAPRKIPGGHTFVALERGYQHSVALTADGTAYSWGDNRGVGGLGQGAYSGYVATPTPVAGGLKFKAISANQHTCALTAAGKAYCWGQNDHGEVGDSLATKTHQHTPIAVATPLTFVSIHAGFFHTVALTASGEAYAWGQNTHGQLGDGTTTERRTPVKVGGGLTFKSIKAGNMHTLGITQSGVAYQWGYLAGPYAVASAPALVPGGLTFDKIAVGALVSVGLTTAGAVYTWGNNQYGVLGDGSPTTTIRLAPAPIAGSGTYTAIAADANHVAALTSAGQMYGWGDNSNGQLALGKQDTTPILIPTFAQPSFTLTVPASASVAGGQGTAAISITRVPGGFTTSGPAPSTAAVTLSASGGPAGMTTTFTPASLSGGTTGSTLTIAASKSVASGTYALTVTGTASGMPTRTGTISVTVTTSPSGGSGTYVCTSETTPASFGPGYQCVSNGGAYAAVKYDMPSTVTGYWLDESAGLCIRWGLGTGKEHLATGKYKNGGLAGPSTTTPEGRWGALVNSNGELSNPTQFYVFTAPLDDQTKLVAYSNGVVVGGGNFTKVSSCPSW